MREIKVLGPGCVKCNKLKELVFRAIEELNSQAKVEHIQEIDEILKYGVFHTPGLIIDGEIKSAGRVPGYNQIKNWLREKAA